MSKLSENCWVGFVFRCFWLWVVNDVVVCPATVVKCRRQWRSPFVDFPQISANCLVVVSIFRYIVICKPEISNKKISWYNQLITKMTILCFDWCNAESRLTPRFSCICVLAAIIYALIWTLPPFFGWSRYVQEPFSTSCSFDWYDRSIGGVTYAFGNPSIITPIINIILSTTMK